MDDSSQASPEPRSDESLMEAYCAGDGQAFAVLVRRHQRGLFNYLLRSVRNRARAEELLQEVLLRVVRSRNRYARSAKFTTWVYTIARNLTVDESRRAKFRRHASLDSPRRGADPSDGRTLMNKIPASQVPTDEAAEAPRMRARMQAALEALPEQQRQVFIMRQVSGLSFREIGEIVDAPENTVKSRMRYALEKLRQELADYRESADDAEPASAADSTSAPGPEGGLVHG